MSQAALLKSFASSFSNQALGGLTNGTKGAALEGAVEIARFNVTLGDLLLLRLELGAKAANAIAKQIKRVDLAVELTATYDGNQGVCHLAKKLAMPLGKLGYYMLGRPVVYIGIDHRVRLSTRGFTYLSPQRPSCRVPVVPPAHAIEA